MTQETLGENRTQVTGWRTPLEEAIWIFVCLNSVIRLQKE